MSEANLYIVPFQFEGKPIRVAEQDGEMWLVAADVCRVLELDNVAMAVRVLDPDEKGVNTVDTPGGSQQMTIISEPGVYKLLGRSRKPEARRFDRWVRHEVLPSIRKHGGYMMSRPEETPEELALRAMTVLQATVERQKAQLAVVEPKATVYDAIISTDGLFNLTTAANILKQKRATFIRYLEANRWLYREKATGRLQTYRPKIAAGLMEQKVFAFEKDGRDKASYQPLFTVKGVVAIAKKLGVEIPDKAILDAYAAAPVTATPPYLVGLNDALRGRLQ